MKPELSVIIVNYNGLRFLQDCLASLYAKLSGVSFEIVVLDNDSADGSCEFIITHFPDVVLIASTENLGFGKGNNEAVKHARGEYLLLINNDTIVLDQLQPALNHLKSDTAIGVIGINMLGGQKQYLPVAGKFPDLESMFRLKKLLSLGPEFASGHFDKESYEVGWLGGSFLLLRTSVYKAIDGFDPAYFMYVEDVDFCKKIADAGLKRIFLPRLRYIHFIGFANKRNPMLIKGYEIYISRHMKGIKKWSCLLALSVNDAVKRAKNLLSLD